MSRDLVKQPRARTAELSSTDTLGLSRLRRVRFTLFMQVVIVGNEL